ncbi:hypothetical protein [Klebsiella phage vB_KpnS-VAC110]|uniref:Uncharacterized protein n=2 Tax=Webervirus TaxID=1920860 RepID=A0AAE8YGM9_9CAUD|nr:hypothetical protein [Klebsiella phage vB_KpnS-VAC113]UKL59184.1 hypothetical protein [Klebsiella phage vB_KpnS-VAC110]
MLYLSILILVRFLRGTCLFSLDFAPDFSWIFTYRDLTILPIFVNFMKCMEKTT